MNLANGAFIVRYVMVSVKIHIGVNFKIPSSISYFNIYIHLKPGNILI
jgi:hypothetical protein